MSFLRRAPVLLPAAVLILFLGAPSAAVAASAPGASTGSAIKVTQSSATVRGAVNPRDVQTTYVFQYCLLYTSDAADE